MHRFFVWTLLFVTWPIGPVFSEEATIDPLSFNDDVRPILSNHCFACHGPDEKHRESDVRLDVPDEVDLDEVIARITSDDPDVVMPPPELNKPLRTAQIETMRRWIDGGAGYDQHWAFVTPAAVPVPELATTAIPSGVDSRDWDDSAIDRFVLARLAAKHRTASGPADKQTLIRRVTLDLTGLPPSIDEVQAFVDDDSDEAFATVVDRLMASPHYGEHMARYWLDLVRFADTNGLHHDHYREMTPYRDWVIDSFNDNLPFDDFIKFQVAGDLFPDPSKEQLIASGFNRLHLIIDVGTALPEESFFRNVVDQVTSVGTAFMGLTVQCAVCHDHKYDPITQRDFYQLYAFYNNFDGAPETGRRGTIDFKRGLQWPYLELPSDEQKAERKRLDKLVAELGKEEKKLKQKKEKDATDEQNLKDVSERFAKATKQRDALLLQIPATLVMKERDEVRQAHILIRGGYDQPGDPVQRQTPGFLPPLKTSGADSSEVPTRMDLAEWFTSPEQPLTARVTVNRFWQQFFGVGLVKTAEDFGAQGQSPSHPELLDHLATRFTASGWDVKALVRSIVMSSTYRQTSTADAEAFGDDPDNRLLARGSRFRLDAEVIRDQVLCVSGLLNPEMSGKSVKVPQPRGLWETVVMPSSYPNTFVPDEGDQIFRRSIYTFWKRGMPPPQMTIFDAPSRESCIARRERTNTPLQALLMMNEKQYFSAAMNFARSLRARSDLTTTQRIASAYQTITSKMPSDAALETLAEAYQQFEATYTADPQAAAAMIESSTLAAVRAIDDSTAQIELAAMTMVVHSMFNLDRIKTHE
ncbi:Planctomycete cytochrome C [Rubripirellula tenax]|uniref:Planctomycete cytochrome C n=2 Tax=Rubripirellula tenax TaxID=2528015 RepID=A0A5C6FFW9_9BACT|nr:Planctomycete cytochrome C [Rubripirellula tenax]